MNSTKTHLYSLWVLASRLSLAYLLMGVMRAVFFAYNYKAFPHISTNELAGFFFYGLRFDGVAVAYANLLVILLTLLPTALRYKLWYKKISFGLFLFSNYIMMCFELGDTLYFPYSARRMIKADFTIQAEGGNLIGSFIGEFLWAIGCSFLLLYLLGRLYKRLPEFETEIPALATHRKQFWAGQFGAMLLGIGLVITMMRGGWQMRPITALNASAYTQNMQFVPLLTNACINIIHSFAQEGLEKYDFFEQPELKQKTAFQSYPPDTSQPMRKLNVVVIVMEGMSLEYFHRYNPNVPLYTPFLDSLFGRGLGFTNAHANGTRSMQGIVSTTTGVPALMQDPFMVSAYQNNRIYGLGAALSSVGYRTNFMHGGNNGTMFFDIFTKSAGYGFYYGRNEYEKARDKQSFDGNWGIYDDRFLDFCAEEISSWKTPFMTTIFTTSPHHPYAIPDSFANLYPNEPRQIRAIRYADAALRHFWEKAKKTDWFENTLFVFTSDHIGLQLDPLAGVRSQRYKIPMVFYQEKDSTLRGERPALVQQIDIYPTILRYLGYEKPFACFGKDILSPAIAENYHYSFDSEIYQILDNEYALHFDGQKSIGLYLYRKDLYLRENIIQQQPQIAQKLENQLKLMIRTHHMALIENKLPQ